MTDEQRNTGSLKTDNQLKDIKTQYIMKNESTNNPTKTDPTIVPIARKRWIPLCKDRYVILVSSALIVLVLVIICTSKKSAPTPTDTLAPSIASDEIRIQLTPTMYAKVAKVSAAEPSEAAYKDRVKKNISTYNKMVDSAINKSTETAARKLTKIRIDDIKKGINDSSSSAHLSY